MSTTCLTDDIRAQNKVLLEGLKETCPEFVAWYGALARWGANIVDGATIDRILSEPAVYRVTMFTRTNAYMLRVRPPSRESLAGYLGCTTSTRCPRAGELQHRGSDLPDGPYSRETWVDIVSGIVAYELVRLGK